MGPVNDKKQVNREYVLVATHRRCKTIRIFLLNVINKSMKIAHKGGGFPLGVVGGNMRVEGENKYPPLRTEIHH
jgi:hypothetical protein